MVFAASRYAAAELGDVSSLRDWHPLLKGGRIFLGLAGRTMGEIIDEILARAESRGLLADWSAARSAVLSREALMSTGMAEGLALPHGRLQDLPEVLGFLGVAAAPVETATLDGAPSRYFVLSLFPDSLAGSYLRFVADVGRFLGVGENRQRILEAGTEAEVEAAFEAGAGTFIR